MLHDERCIRCGACAAACPNGAVTLEDGAPVTDRSTCRVCGTCADACWADARQLAGRAMTAEQVLAAVERDRPFYERSSGGLTLSGGEPLRQPEFAAELLAAAHARGLHTALDTCGHAAWAVLDAVRRDVDLFLFDLKLADPARHRRCTGVGNETILANLRRLAEGGHRIVLRCPVVPGITDDDDNLAGLRAIASGLPQLERIELLPYHGAGAGKYRRLARNYRLPRTEAPTPRRMSDIASFLAAGGLTVGGG